MKRGYSAPAGWPLLVITSGYQFFGTQRSIGNVPITPFGDGHDTVGFPIHSFLTFERVRKHSESENSESPYFIRVSGVERTINICGVASRKCEIIEWKP